MPAGDRDPGERRPVRLVQSLQGKFLLGMLFSGLVLVCLTLLFALSWKFQEVRISPALFLVVIVCVLLLVIPGLLIHQSIVRRLRALVDTAHRVGAGNLSERVEVDVHDEIGALARAFNEMTARMQQTLLETKRSQEFLEKVLNNIDLGIVVIDREFRVVTANRAYFDGRPLHSESALRECCFEKHQHGYDCRMTCPARVSFREGRATRDVHRHLGEDGREITVEIFSAPLLDEQGEVAMVVLVSKDITTRVEMEKKLVRSDRMALVGQMASGLAHEIKNPIAGISAAIQIIGQSLGEADPNREIFDEIQHQIERMKRTLSDLLSYAKPRRPRFVDYDVNELIRRSVALLEPNANRNRITLDLHLQETSATCRIDPDMIQQVLLNVCLNAIQAQPRGGRIRVETSLRDQGAGIVVITLQDEGPGIPPEILERIFDPFFTTKHTGTGLGLPISDQILEEHEGSLEIDSVPGGGTTCRILLPVSSPEGSRPVARTDREEEDDRTA